MKPILNPATGKFDMISNKIGEIYKLQDTVDILDHTNGIVEITDSTISFVDGTRTFSITPTGASFVVYVAGVKYTITTTQSLVIPDTEGLYYIYFDTTGALQYQVGGDDVTYYDRAYLSNLYWDATNNLGIFVGDERHGIKMSVGTHRYLHETMKSRIETGFAMDNFVVDGNGSLATHAETSVDPGIFFDEDLEHVVPGLTVPANIGIFYQVGPSGTWRKKVADNFPLIYKQAGTNARADYNQFTGGVWQLTEVTNLDFVLMHYFVTNDIANPVIGICGQAMYASLADARAGADVEIANIVTAGIPTEEFIAIGTVIFQTANGYSNTPASRIRSTTTGENYVDWRTTTVLSLSGGGVVWGTIGGTLSNQPDLEAALTALQPSSPTNSIQFNNGGVFGGDSNLVWDNTNKFLGVGQGVYVGSTLNNLLLKIFSSPPSYTNIGGSGNRTLTISVSTTIGVLGGSPSRLINGDYSTQNWYWNNQAAAGLYLRFDFFSSIIITESKFYQQSAYSHGTWKWQGSNDLALWTDVGSSFTLGGSTTQTQTSLNGNTMAFRYYQLLGISGSMVNNPYIYQFDFKTSYVYSNMQILEGDGTVSGGAINLQPSGGFVGIGTINPTTNLDIVGDEKISGNVSTGTLNVTGNAGVGGFSSAIRFLIIDDGSVAFNGDVLAVHAHSSNPYVASFYNDTVSASVPAFQYYIDSAGNFDMGTPGTKNFNFYTNGYANPRLTITGTGNIGIGTISPNANAILDISSTTKAFMPPRMTTTQKAAITSPTAGMVVFDSTLGKLCVYGNGATWETITSI